MPQIMHHPDDDDGEDDERALPWEFQLYVAVGIPVRSMRARAHTRAGRRCCRRQRKRLRAPGSAVTTTPSCLTLTKRSSGAVTLGANSCFGRLPLR